ncbi:MAG: ABC transporter ATP-binding protein [Candidatus Hydrothermarchaeota archaeon]
MILEGIKITKFYGSLRVLNEVDFSVKKGEVLGLIGPNGAGKTTLFDIITGLTPPTSGRIIFEGKDITKLKPHQICRRGIGRTFQIARPFQNMSALKNVMIGLMFGKKNNLSIKDAKREALNLLNFVGLAGKENTLGKNLTVTEQKKLELAKALATKPKLLLLDEVAAGLSPTAMLEALELLNKVKETGITVFVIDHVLKAIMEICERIIVLDNGNKIAEGKPAEIARDERVIETYLGERYVY